MARKKVTLKLIADRSARRATFKKRRENLMKKARELSTLCGVDACVVVYGEGGAPPPSSLLPVETFPASAAEAARVLNRFREMPEEEQSKKMLDMEGFLRQRNDKLMAQLEKARRANDEREAALLLSGAVDGRRPVADLSADELAVLGRAVSERLKSVDERIQKLHEQGHAGDPLTALHLSLASLPPPLLVPYTAGVKAEGFGGAVKTEGHAPAGAQGRIVNVKTEGFRGGSGRFRGDAVGASSSGGADDTDMPQAQLRNTTFAGGFPWAARQGPSFFPPPM